jgi:TolC family type I secretion outer membrane protein
MMARRNGITLFFGLLVCGVAVTSALALESPKKLNLNEALRLAWKANPSLQISRVEELIAGEEVVRARSGFLPQVRAQVSQTIYDDPTKIKFATPTTGNVPAGFPLTNRNFWSSQVTLEQTLFDFWATSSRYQAAVLGKGATRLDTAQVQDNIFLTVSQGYFRVLRAEKLVTVAQQEVVQLKDHLRIARDLYEFGVATYNDVLQAEVALSDAEQRLITAKNDVITFKSNLNKVMGLPIPTPLSLAEENDLTVPAWQLEQASEAALKQRSDLKATQSRIKQGEKNITQAKSGYYPRFYLQAGHTFQQNDFWLHENQYFAIFGMQWSLFSGLDTRAQVRQARERLEQLQLQKQDLTEQVRLDVQTAYLGLKETADRIRVTQKAVAQGEENLRLNEERYKEQVGTATDVIDAQTLLTKARVNFFNARYDHQMAKAQMLWAVGAINDLLTQKKSEHAP